MANRDERDEAIVRFLYGEMPEDERERIEAHYFSDSDYFERVCAVENDLVDRYARRQLTRNELERFERGYLTTSARRKRVAFARSLAQATAQVQTRAANDEEQSRKPLSWWRSFIAALSGPRLLAPLSVAMGLILLAGGLWAALEISKLRRDLAAASREQAAKSEREQELAGKIEELEKRIAEGGSERDDLAQELERLRQQQQELESQRQPQPGKPSVLSFVLGAGAQRAGGKTPTLTITREVDFVRLQMNFDGGNYPAYQAQISTVEGAQVFSQTGLRARQIKNGAAVSVRIPAQRLDRADYILTLSGVTASGGLEEVNRFFFRVERK